MTCREWLRNNHYEDVVTLIDAAMANMIERGSKQRRNWWDILSGGLEGKSCVCEGIEFPVLRVAQRRQGKPVTKNAIGRNAREQPPEIIQTRRWNKQEARSKPRSKSNSLQQRHSETIHRRAS